MRGLSKKHQETEKLLCIPQEQRRASMKVGETPGNGEESPSFREEPKFWRRTLLCIPAKQRRASIKVGETPGNGEESPNLGEEPKESGEMDIKKSDVSVRSIQLKIVDVLKEFQRVCKKHNLQYFAIGGTCIGAVRHNGFIPWDDDIDVAMPYEDYVRFIEIAENELETGYSLIGPDNCRHYLSSYIKLHDQNTTFIESFCQKYPDRYTGVYIDIFPIFGLPNNKIKQRVLEARCQIQNRLNVLTRFPLCDEISLKGKIIWLLCIPLRWILPLNYFVEKQRKMLSVYPIGAADKVIFCWRPIPKKEKQDEWYKNIFLAEDFRSSLETPFEDITISIPIGYDRYLRMEFGDYMKLPPIEKQISLHPKAIVDLEQTYKSYIGGNSK